jgi:hypothetical protein
VLQSKCPTPTRLWLSHSAVERRAGKLVLLRFDYKHLGEARIETELHTGPHAHSSRPRNSLVLPTGLLLLGTSVLVALGDKNDEPRLDLRVA